MERQTVQIALAEEWPRLLPGCYEALDGLLAKRGGKTLPVSAVYLYLYDACRNQQQAGMLASELTACWLWQRFGAFRSFDAGQTAQLARKAGEGSLRMQPAARLLALPRSTYCRAPQLLEMMDGFFCWINEETARPPELRVQWLSSDQKHSVTQRLPLAQGASLRDCFYAAFPAAYGPEGTPDQQQAKKMEGMLWQALSFVWELLEDAGPGAGTAPAPKDGAMAPPNAPKTTKKAPFWQRWGRQGG